MVLIILKILATSDFMKALECTKFVFGLGSARTPLKELTVLPQTPYSCFKGPTSKVEGEEGERKGRGEKGKVGNAPPAFCKFFDLP